MSDIQKDYKKDVLEVNPQDKKGLTDSFRIFFSNDYHTFIIQKTEKLASALYVMTGFIAVEEPVRLKLRTCALDLITHTCDSNRFQEKGTEQFVSRCAEIGTILETAIKAGLVSRMNAELICNEYASLAHFVRNNQSKISDQSRSGRSGPMTALSLKSPMEDGPFQNYGRERTFKGQKTVTKKRQLDRRTSILNIFKNKDKISIKDAVSLINGCSEKTIQRELIALVRDGVLVKEGARRWTTYRKVAREPQTA
ncbi:MAG: hypothetical protein AAB923_00845 [Patescibacteria group bacterium]